MYKINTREFGIFFGNLLVFVSIFMPWYSVNHYGNIVSYTGIEMASSLTELSILYLLPLLSGVLMSYVAMNWIGEKHQNSGKYLWITGVAVAVAIVAIVFVSLIIYPVGIPLYALNGLSIGGYAAITGALMSLFFIVYPSS